MKTLSTILVCAALLFAGWFAINHQSDPVEHFFKVVKVDSRVEFGSGLEHFTNSQHLMERGIDPALYDANYLLELKALCNDTLKNQPCEVAVINSSMPLRGDLVNELFDRVPIIVAHETNKIGVWDKVNIPSNYEKIVFSQGQGSTFWVRKDKTEAIQALQRDAGIKVQETPRRNLRVFFPQMHPVLVQSVALALQHLGHTLVLPGESFDPKSDCPGFKISYGTYFKKNPLESGSYTSFFSENPEECTFLKQNVEVIENDEMLTHPPDVLFVNCKEVEKSVCEIWDHFKEQKKNSPKLAHFSGNNATRYKSRYMKNLIAVDAYTANYYDRSKTNIIFWIPWIDFENLTFEGVSDSPVLNSYIGHYGSILKKSAEVFNETVSKAQEDFPHVGIISYPNSTQMVRHNQIPALIHQSCATLHIKETEGFGFTIIESLAKGRPVFLKRSFSQGSRLMNWCIEGKTAFFFDDYAEFHDKLEKYVSDAEYRHQVQTDCAQLIRILIDNEKQAKVLDRFLQNLD